MNSTHTYLCPKDSKDEEEQQHHNADIAHGGQAERQTLEDLLHAG
jgi:hypothetical protein